MAAGSTYRFEKSEALRLVSLALGKLHVQLEGEPTFVVGMHGLFKIRPGVGCTVANDMTVDCTVHITAIDM